MCGGLDSGETLVFPELGVKGIKHGNVDDGHGTAGAAGAELLAESAMFPGSDGGVVQTSGVDGDLVPAMDRLVGISLCLVGVAARLRVKEWAVGLPEIACRADGENSVGEQKEQY